MLIPAKVAANLILLILLSFVGLVTYWWIVNVTYPATLVTDIKMKSPNVLHVGDVLEVEYIVERRRDCEVLASRMFRRPDGREIELLRTIWLTRAEPGIKRQSGYTVRIPQALLSANEDGVSGDLYSLNRYYCNGLDYLMPRFQRTEFISLTILK